MRLFVKASGRRGRCQGRVWWSVAIQGARARRLGGAFGSSAGNRHLCCVLCGVLGPIVGEDSAFVQGPLLRETREPAWSESAWCLSQELGLGV